MYKRIIYVLLTGLIGLTACARMTINNSDNACGEWSLVGRGTKLVPLHPVTHTEYWLWTFSRREQSRTAFRITGQFPYARYSSFQSYSPTKSVAIADFQIVPDPGSVNPARPGVDRYSSNRSYAIWFVPPGSTREGQQNTIVMPEDTEAPNLVMRILKPDKGQARGGVALPRIAAFDDATRESEPCPKKGWDVNFRPVIVPIPSAEDPIGFYRLTGDGFGPNKSNAYLFAQLPPPSDGKVAIVRFKVPTFPDTSKPNTVFAGEEDVRYMGLCVHGLVSTLTSDCLADDELIVDNSGFATVVAGPEQDSLRAQVKKKGYNYLSWKLFRSPILLYRQVLPRDGFAGSAGRVPVYNSNMSRERQRAQKFMGDYAPTGRVCSTGEFLRDNCALP